MEEYIRSAAARRRGGTSETFRTADHRDITAHAGWWGADCQTQARLPAWAAQEAPVLTCSHAFLDNSTCSYRCSEGLIFSQVGPAAHGRGLPGNSPGLPVRSGLVIGAVQFVATARSMLRIAKRVRDPQVVGLGFSRRMACAGIRTLPCLAIEPGPIHGTTQHPRQWEDFDCRRGKQRRESQRAPEHGLLSNRPSSPHFPNQSRPLIK